MIQLSTRAETLHVEMHLDADLARDIDVASEAITVISAAHDELTPETIMSGDPRPAFTPERAATEWMRAKDREVVLIRPGDNGSITFASHGRGKKRTTNLSMRLPLALFASQSVSDAFVGALGTLARLHPARYGFAQMSWDFDLGERPIDPTFQPQIVETYWFNLLGSELVRKLGADRVRSTPAHRVESLPDGAVAIVTRPTPVDYYTHEAVDARTRALQHLRPDLNAMSIATRYRERAAVLAPVEHDWDADIARLLGYTLRMEALDKRRAKERSYNTFRPAVTEWKPAAEALPADVDEVEASRSEADYVDGLYFVVNKKLDTEDDGEPEWLEKLDAFFWMYGHQYFNTPEHVEKIIPLIGTCIGNMLVDELDGQWRWRRNLDESVVIIGDRAWLPFVRARHYAKSRQTVLEYSLMKFFREAERTIR